MAPVYGQFGVELSGLAADAGYFDCCGFGNDSERCLSHSDFTCTSGVMSLKRCLIFLIVGGGFFFHYDQQQKTGKRNKKPI